MNYICLFVLFVVFMGIVFFGYDIVADIIPDIKEVFRSADDEEFE